MRMLLVDEIVGSFERERSLTAAAMARVGDLRCWEEQFRRSWQRVYAVDAEFTPAVLEKIARRMFSWRGLFVCGFGISRLPSG